MYACLGKYLRVGVYACSHACVLLSQADKRANERTRAGHLCGTSKSCSPGARSCAANTPSPSRGLCRSSSLLMSTACSSCSHILSPLARIPPSTSTTRFGASQRFIGSTEALADNCIGGARAFEAKCARGRVCGGCPTNAAATEAPTTATRDRMPVGLFICTVPSAGPS